MPESRSAALPSTIAFCETAGEASLTSHLILNPRRATGEGIHKNSLTTNEC